MLNRLLYLGDYSAVTILKSFFSFDQGSLLFALGPVDDVGAAALLLGSTKKDVLPPCMEEEVDIKQITTKEV